MFDTPDLRLQYRVCSNQASWTFHRGDMRMRQNGQNGDYAGGG